MSAGALYSTAKADTTRLINLLQSEIKKDVLAVTTEVFTHSETFTTKATVGIMLFGTHVDNVVFGGPAQTAGIERGDDIISVDGVSATNDNVTTLLKGTDVPNSAISVVYSKGGPRGEIKTVSLLREATGVIQDRRRMFELFNTLKDRAMQNKDKESINVVDQAVELWNKMWMADHVHDSKIAQNVTELQKKSAKLSQDLSESITRLTTAGDALAAAVGSGSNIQTPTANLAQYEQQISQLRAQLAAAGDRPDPPVIRVSGGRVFKDQIAFTLETTEPGTQVIYTLDGSEPGPSSQSGRSPLQLALNRPALVRAVSVVGGRRSNLAWEEFVNPPAGLLGITLMKPADGTPAFVERVSQTGAAAALGGKVAVGDRLLMVDGRDVSHASIEEINSLMRGYDGTPVELRLARPGQAHSHYVTIIRRAAAANASVASLAGR